MQIQLRVYEAWLVDGYLEEHERDQLSKRVRELKVNCEKYISPVPHLSSQSGIVSPPSTTDKVLVDVCTNTPCRADLSTLLSTGDEDESFFSIKSDRTNVSDRSYASAITSPVGPDPRQRLLREKISGISLAQELNGDKKMSSERQRGKPTAADKLSKSGNLSVTPTTQVVFSGRMEDRSLNGLASCQSSEYSAFSQTGTSGVIPNNTLVDSTNTVSKNTLFNGFASVAKPPCGKVLDKDEATSFWKGKSVGLPIFGRSQANITASDTNNVFGQQALKNVAPVSSVLGKAANMPCEHFSSPISGFAGQRNSDLGECSPLDALIPVISQTPQNIDSFSSTVNAEDQNEDENFYNNLVMELCQRRMGGSSKKLDPDSTDMEALQRKITQIEEQMRKTRSRLCGSTKIVCFAWGLITDHAFENAEKQHETLLELERKVAQLMNSQILSNISPQPTMTVPSAKPLNSKRSDVPCADPINLFRGLLMSSSNSGDCANLGKPMTEVMENTKITSTALKSSSEVKVQSDVAHNPLQSMERRKNQFSYGYFLVNREAVARHAGNSGLCLGCMDDDAQDLALRILEQLANDWNTICDSDSD
uniref:Tower domain-containing protein n=1 Tax=Angiostrongylus cantonensis TaxID=6313 RepID=A0A0K0DR77_ANGCA